MDDTTIDLERPRVGECARAAREAAEAIRDEPFALERSQADA